MSPVFAHGQLRLYLLVLLDEGPRHGYEVIQELESRFNGLYSPSAGTVYPRLAKLEEEGLVQRTDEAARGPTRSPTPAGPRSGRGRPMSRTCGTTSTSRCGSSPNRCALGCSTRRRTSARS